MVHDHKFFRFDPILYLSTGVIIFSILASIIFKDVEWLNDFSGATIELLKTMWWGIVLGITVVGFMGKVPRAYFNTILGRGDTVGGVIRATIAGLVLDLCSHGIVMVGAKLYERGASLAQVMAFLIASPWNSLSLTIILISLIGLKWTLVFVAGSALIAIITGIIYLGLIKGGVLPANPNTADVDEDFSIREDISKKWKERQEKRKSMNAGERFKATSDFILDSLKAGLGESRMILRWLFLGVVIAACIRAFMPTDMFTEWFGPSLIGLGMTLLATTIIEVCSEGSAPVAAEIINRAGAPGNGFVFLMAGVSTDYTEMMVIREFSKSWKIALSLPIITVPQVVLIGWLINMAGG